MIIVKVKEGENIDRALKRFKRKFERTGVIKQVRARKAFKKPSEIKREVMQKAIYIEQLRRNAEH
jgi:small subunit ribosomal protein S21